MRIMLPIALAGLAALTGCVGYGGGVAYTSGGAYYDSPYYGSSTGVVIQQRYGYPYSTYGANRRDRDGDGVPNWRDSRPRNPFRY